MRTFKQPLSEEEEAYYIRMYLEGEKEASEGAAGDKASICIGWGRRITAAHDRTDAWNITKLCFQDRKESFKKA